MPLSIDLPRQFLRQRLQANADELALFRGLMTAMAALPNCSVAEFHGTKHQVTFAQLRGAGRANPRCEISDLLILSFRSRQSVSLRATWLQAKVAHGLGPLPLCNGTLSNRLVFRANLEQWDLLGNRPVISGVFKTFQPPGDLLRSAPLPSVGTFGVFYPIRPVGWDMAYFVADRLAPRNNLQFRNGSLVFDRGDFLQQRTFGAYAEVQGTCCLKMFGDGLDRSLIGTPLAPVLNAAGAAPTATRRWFSGLLITLQTVESMNRDSIVELRELFEVDPNAPPTAPGAKAVALLRIEA
jgi:hypothetical protein